MSTLKEHSLTSLKLLVKLMQKFYVMVILSISLLLLFINYIIVYITVIWDFCEYEIVC